MLKMSCNKYHLQEVSHWKRRGRDANSRQRRTSYKGRGETGIDVSEDFMMIGMCSLERNTFCTPPPASISQVSFNSHSLASGKNNCEFTSTRYGQHTACALRHDVKRQYSYRLRVCSWPRQYFALGRADLPLFVTSKWHIQVKNTLMQSRFVRVLCSWNYA
jgi:hypothetical protein